MESGSFEWKVAIGITPPFQFHRAAAFTAAMFALAASAHLLAGGSLPDPTIVAGLFALTLAPVMIVAKTRITAPVMTVLLGSSQLLLHEAFNGLSVPTAFTPISDGHLHGTGPVLPLTSTLMPEHAAAPGSLMLILHTAATLVTALVLARGEAAVWALAAWLRPLIRILTAVVIFVCPHLRAPLVLVIPSRWRSLRLPALRGPPAAPSAL
ncbi:hypothetical protein ACTWLI_03780 [Arthrobacter sp. Hor0625]|uniref:hypothetical protein n=1 Tax=Arthrobacter sp. Hor0625 TaxID=3457358 RepID=UPI00403E9661